MDEADLKLLKLLQENARYSLKYLAQEVFLSTPAVSSRILRLEDKGVINGYSANININKLGYNIKAFINLEVEPKQKPEFYPYIAACPNVLECNCVTGKFSMLLKVAFHTTEELDSFINEIQKFGHTETQIVFSTPVEHRGIVLE